MRNLRKMSLLLLALITASMMLMACGSGSSPGSAEADSGSQTNKEITIRVVHGDNSEKVFEISTSADVLGEVLREEKLAEGEESDTGLFVQTVDGETADDSQQEWWNIQVNGQMAMTGVDEIEIADGDEFELILTTGY